MTLLEPLSPEAEKLLALERKPVPASPELRARVMARARAALVHGGAALRRPFSWRGRVPATLAAALVLGVAALSLAAWRARYTEKTPEQGAAPVVSPALQPPTASLDSTVSATSPEAGGTPSAAAEQPEAVPAAATPKDDKGRSPRRLPDADAYAAELSLLQQARAAVATAKYSAAVGFIAEHERRFPAGRLREERDALRVKALAGLGRSDDARSAAERFRARYPRSVLSPGIEAATRRAP